MELQTILILVAALACPIGMGVMMYMMNKQGSHRGYSMPSQTAQTSEADRLKALREQRRLLEQEIAEAEKVAALEAKKETLARVARPSANDGRPKATDRQN